MEYATNAKGNLGVTLGAVGTGLGLLDGGANLLGRMMGGGAGSPEDKPVTRYEMGLIRESIDQKIENGYLRGRIETTTLANQTAELRNNFDRLTRVFVPNDNVAPGWGFANVQPAPPLPPYPYFGFPYPPFPAPPTQATTTTDSTTANG